MVLDVGGQAKYDGGKAMSYGNITGSSAFYVALAPDERLTGMFGREDGLIMQLGFNTSANRTYGPWGRDTGAPFSFNEGYIVGLFGREINGRVGGLGAWATMLTPPPTVPPPLATHRFAPCIGAVPDTALIAGRYCW
jgi:hypothetical protein